MIKDRSSANADIRYWIYLYLDAYSNLRGYVELYRAWAECGFNSDERVAQQRPEGGCPFHTFSESVLSAGNGLH